MARRIVYVERCAPNGFEYAIELISTGQSGVDLDYDVELSVPGFELTYNNGVDDVKPPIIPSSVSIDMLVPCEYRNAIAEAVYNYHEFNLVCRIHVDGFLYWAGIVHSEAFSETIEDGSITMSFTASDGLAQLKNMDFKDENGEIYTGFKSYIEWIYLCLSKLPHYSYTLQSAVSPFLNEFLLPRFKHPDSGDLSVNKPLLKYIHLHGNGFYSREELGPQVINGFERIRPALSDEFISTYDILEDLMASISSSICYSNGRWWIFDRAGVFTVPTDSLQYISYNAEPDGIYETSPASVDVIDLDAENFYFMKGAVRSGAYPFFSVSQQHKDADSDLLIGDGIAFNINRIDNAVFDSQNLSRRVNRVILQYSKFNGWGDFPGTGNIPGYTNWLNDLKYTVNDVVIPSGNDGGQIRIKLGGTTVFGEFGQALLSLVPVGSFNSREEGSVLIVGFMVEVSNGVNSFRLQRAVRTLNNDSNGDPYSVDITGENDNYKPKFYTGYKWVRDDDPEYAVSRLEILIGADPTILQHGVTERFLNTDYPNTAFFTPPRTKVGSSDNILKATQDKERREFIWQFNEIVDMPLDSDNGNITLGSLTSIKVHNPVIAHIPNWASWNAYRDGNGNVIPVGTFIVSDSNYTLQPYIIFNSENTSYVNGGPDWLRHFLLIGFELSIGDGSYSYNNISRFTPDEPKGYESVELQSTTFGSTFVNYLSNIKGKIYGTSPTYNTYKDNLQWLPHSFNSEDDYYNRLGHYNCGSAMQIRGETRHYVSGTLDSYRDGQSRSLIQPFSVVKTGQLDPTSDEYFIPFELSITPEGYRVGLLRRNVDRVIILGVSDDDKLTKGPDIIGGTDDGDTGGTVELSAITDQDLTDAIEAGGGGGIPDDIFPIFITRK